MKQTWIGDRNKIQSWTNEPWDRVDALEEVLERPEEFAVLYPSDDGSSSAREAVAKILPIMHNHFREVFTAEDRASMLTSQHLEIRDLVPAVTPSHWVLRWIESGTPEERKAAFMLSSVITPRPSRRHRRR